MESHDQSHLLLCDKEDLVKYIMKLRVDSNELKEKIICLESDSYNEVSLTEYEELEEENEELKMNTHRLNCSHCNLISSEDDIFLSLDCGEFTCEECFNEGKSKNIKEENESLKKTCLKWQEKADFNLTDSDEE